MKLEVRWQMIVNDETEDQERDNDGNSKGLRMQSQLFSIENPVAGDIFVFAITTRPGGPSSNPA